MITIVAILFAIILAATRSPGLGDTELYASNIADQLGKSPLGHPSAIWEFGHLLWRPLGWAVLSVTTPVLSALTGWTPFMQACLILIAIGMASSIVTVILWYLLVLDLTTSRKLAVRLAIALACSHGVLLYAHSGCAYIPGLMCITASLYCLRKNRPGAGAVLYAIATLLWLPYILAGAALFALAAFPKETPKSFSLNRAIRFIAISAACVILGYGLVLAARHTASVKEARDWYAESNHGSAQSIRLLRIATGLPRSFLYLGRDGVLYKRFLLHDPYSPAGAGDLVRASLWKIALFDLFAACLLFELFRRRTAAWPLTLLLLAAGPVVFFAVFLFEPSSPERYLPALPFLLIAIAWVMRDFPKNRSIPQIVIAAFLICIVLNNGFAFLRPRISAEDNASWQRVASLRPRLNRTGLFALLSDKDTIEDVVSRSPFSPINYPRQLPLYDVVQPGNVRILHWREEFAGMALRAWSQGGEVWISKRVWAARPLPEWEWVEGDDPNISWSEIPRFFAPVETDAESGGTDGFRRLSHSNVNVNRLTALGAAAK